MGKHDHPHVEASGASLAKAAQTALEGAGEAWTDMRAQIFDAVAAIGKPAMSTVPVGAGVDGTVKLVRLNADGSADSTFNAVSLGTIDPSLAFTSGTTRDPVTNTTAQFPISTLCQVLQVSPSGFYAARGRPESTHAQTDRRLRVLVRASKTKAGEDRSSRARAAAWAKVSLSGSWKATCGSSSSM